jgi:hypothetical protein
MARRNMNKLARVAELVADVRSRIWSLFFLVVTGRALAEDDLTGDEYERVFEFMYQHPKSGFGEHPASATAGDSYLCRTRAKSIPAVFLPSRRETCSTIRWSVFTAIPACSEFCSIPSNARESAARANTRRSAVVRAPVPRRSQGTIWPKIRAACTRRRWPWPRDSAQTLSCCGNQRGAAPAPRRVLSRIDRRSTSISASAFAFLSWTAELLRGRHQLRIYAIGQNGVPVAAPRVESVHPENMIAITAGRAPVSTKLSNS